MDLILRTVLGDLFSRLGCFRPYILAAVLRSPTQALSQNPGPCCPLCSVCTWPWPLKTSSSAWGAAVLFELLPLGKGELAFLCRDFWCEWELRWDAEGSALLTAVPSMLETAQREENLLPLYKSFFGSSGKIFRLPEQQLKSILPGQKCKDGNSCLNLSHFLRVPCPWYVLFHALMWNLPVTDADGCRIKCTFLWLCQVDMQQRAQLEKPTADSVQSQDCWRELLFLRITNLKGKAAFMCW